MNEGLAVFLNLGEGKSKENEELIKRIDELLLDHGIEYTGIGNMYRPADSGDRDRAVFNACRALNEADWLKDKLADISIMNRIDACPLDQIKSEHMSEPSASKIEYYEKYYQKSHMLAQGIIIDENRRIRDGYTSFIIAKKYGIRPNIYEAFAKQPLRKIVRGRHVFWDGDEWQVKSNKIYAWNYTLKRPVVPGDILQVQTKKGQDFICVHEIGYVTGKEFCAEHRKVIRHL